LSWCSASQIVKSSRLSKNTTEVAFPSGPSVFTRGIVQTFQKHYRSGISFRLVLFHLWNRPDFPESLPKWRFLPALPFSPVNPSRLSKNTTEVAFPSGPSVFTRGIVQTFQKHYRSGVSFRFVLFHPWNRPNFPKTLPKWRFLPVRPFPPVKSSRLSKVTTEVVPSSGLSFSPAWLADRLWLARFTKANLVCRCVPIPRSTAPTPRRRCGSGSPPCALSLIVHRRSLIDSATRTGSATLHRLAMLPSEQARRAKKAWGLTASNSFALSDPQGRFASPFARRPPISCYRFWSPSPIGVGPSRRIDWVRCAPDKVPSRTLHQLRLPARLPSPFFHQPKLDPSRGIPLLASRTRSKL
jgi:hypothetical protein